MKTLLGLILVLATPLFGVTYDTQFAGGSGRIDYKPAQNGYGHVDLAGDPSGGFFAAFRETNHEANPETSSFQLHRYGSDGTLDSSFSLEPALTTHSAGGDYKLVLWTVLPSRSGVYALRSYRSQSGTPVSLSQVFKMGPDGKLDKNFGSQGVLEIPLLAYAAATDSKGRIVLMTVEKAFQPIFVKVFDSSGAPDAAFGQNGTLSVPRLRFFSAHLLVDQQDRILIASTTGSAKVGRVERYLPSGAADISFATNGAFELPHTDNLAALGIYADSSQVLLHYLVDHRAPSPPKQIPLWKIVRLHADGAVDENYGTAGHGIDLPNGSFQLNARIGATQNGGVFAVGTSSLVTSPQAIQISRTIVTDKWGKLADEEQRNLTFIDMAQLPGDTFVVANKSVYGVITIERVLTP